MSENIIRWSVVALVTLVIALAGCNRGPDLESPEVRQAWLQANEEKMAEILRSQGFQVQKTGESQVVVARYSRHGEGVCVIFMDGTNDPPQAVIAAYLLPTSEDGSSWRIAGYVSAAGTGDQMKTVTFERSMTEDAPNVAFQLDMFLASRNMKREKLPAEEVMNLF